MTHGSPGSPVNVSPQTLSMNYIATEDRDFKEADLKKLAKEKLQTFMSNSEAVESAKHLHQTAQLLLTNEVSSATIITLMHIIRDTMINDEALNTVQLIQKLIQNMLDKPLVVGNFFDDLNNWFKDPQSLANVQYKDSLVEYCIRLAVQTKCLDNLTIAIDNMEYENAPEIIEALFKQFDFLVEMNASFRIQDAWSYGTKKLGKGVKSVVSWKKSSSTSGNGD